MTHAISSVRQNIYFGTHDPIFVEDVHENMIFAPVLLRLVDSAKDGIVGLATTYHPDCSLSGLAFATLTRALIVHFSPSPQPTAQKMRRGQQQQQQPSVSRGRILLRDYILCDPNIQLYGFRMDRIAVALFLDLSLRINAAVDILSVSSIQAGRRSLQAIINALGGDLLIRKVNVEAIFLRGKGGDARALQAWGACRAATLEGMASRYASVSRIATDTMSDVYLSALAKISRHAEKLESLKPTEVVNDVKGDFVSKEGNLNLQCTRFGTRIMKGREQVIHIETLVGDRKSTVTGRAAHIDGRRAQINLKGAVNPSGKVISVTTFGKGDLIAAETFKEDVVLKALQGTIELTQHPFFCSIWTPSLGISWPPLVQDGSTNALVSNPLIHYPCGTLNASQEIAVRRIVSEADEDRVVLIQGPPGTGKTTVIAASILSIMEYGNKDRTVWLVAQSNVAVKNIAEKLDKVEFREFKLLVSKDFHYDWHEHLYERLKHCIILSESFVDGSVAMSRLILDSRVVLCTLSMLSHPLLGACSRIVPVRTVIFDEASQIEVGDYLPMLHRFKPDLQKMVFIGDDKQLAPYGHEDIQQLQSVFEFPHLRKRACFLNTQYRMPVIIGDFISRNVYDHKLKTEHNINSKTACRFVDVKRGQEKSSGNSWINEQEIAVIIHLARLYHQQGRQYRVITPYDAQRTAIERQLKSAGVPWEDKCFNVDSFQGNEEDHIIVSLVRSERVGFLNNLRRTNVMLTRCKKSMIICTSRNFVMIGNARDTLVGKLAAAMGPEGWLDSRDVLRGVLP